jgi:hypothetical protein
MTIALPDTTNGNTSGGTHEQVGGGSPLMAAGQLVKQL